MIKRFVGFALLALMLILLMPLVVFADQARNKFNLLHAEMVVGDSTGYVMDVDTVVLPPALYKDIYIVLSIDTHGTAEANDSAWVQVVTYVDAVSKDSLDSRLASPIQYIMATSTLIDSTAYVAITNAGEASVFVISTCVGGDASSAQDSIYVRSGYIPIEHEIGF